MDPCSNNPVCSFEVSLLHSIDTDARARSHFLEFCRPIVEQHIARAGVSPEFDLPTPMGTLRISRRAGDYQPGSPFTLAFGGKQPLVASRQARDGAATLPSIRLPCEATHELGGRLVGLDHIAEDIVLRLKCRWDGLADIWSAETGIAISPAVHARLTNNGSLMLFAGIPGTGKSALARVICDWYTREHNIEGTILWLGTERGNGMVGDLAKTLHASFRQLAELPAGELRCLVIDEADTFVERRSHAHQHKEDTAAVNCIIQELDRIAGQERTLVIMTTNLPDRIDPAILRRADVFAFGRPEAVARRQMLGEWLPHLSAKDLTKASRRALGMTPADMEKALETLWMTALRTGLAIQPATVFACLRSGTRTDAV